MPFALSSLGIPLEKAGISGSQVPSFENDPLSVHLAQVPGSEQVITGSTPKLDVLKSKTILGTDSNGKIVEGTHQSLAAHAKLDDKTQTITSEQHRLVGDIEVTYDGDFVDTVTIGDREITFNNDGSDYTSWEDADYEWTPTYDGDGKLTAMGVMAK